MIRKYDLLYFITLFFIVSIIPLHCLAAERINNYVLDNAHVFDADVKTQLEDALKELEVNSGGVQVVVFTEYSIPNGTTLEERSLAIATDNGIGSSKEDNGLLFYLAVNDRQFRWEAGYGLESQLNSAKLGRISRDFMVPKFQEGNYQDGIISGLAQIENILQGNNTINESLTDTYHQDNTYQPGWILVILFFLISNPIILIIAIILITYLFKIIFRKKGMKTSDIHYINAASSLFNNFGRGGSLGGGFSGGGGHFGGGGFSGKF